MVPDIEEGIAGVSAGAGVAGWHRSPCPRMMLAMSQEKLGDALDFTFQQVQKYEKAANRIVAGQ